MSIITIARSSSRRKVLSFSTVEAQKALTHQLSEDMRKIQQQFVAACGGSFAQGQALPPDEKGQIKKVYGDRFPGPFDISKLKVRTPKPIYNATICVPSSGVTRLAVIDLDNHTPPNTEAWKQINTQNMGAAQTIMDRLRQNEKLHPILIRSGGGVGYQILIRWDDPQPIPAVSLMLKSVAEGFVAEKYPVDNPGADYGKAIDIPGQRSSSLVRKTTKDIGWEPSPAIHDSWIRAADQRKAMERSYDRQDVQPELVKECLKRIPRPDIGDERFKVVVAAFRAGGAGVKDAVVEWWNPGVHLAEKTPRAHREFLGKLAKAQAKAAQSEGAGLGSLIALAKEADPTFSAARKPPVSPALKLVPLGQIPIEELHSEPIVKKAIYAGHVTMIYGPSGGGKTLFGVALACSVACGVPVLYQPTVKSKVGYYAIEAPASVIKRCHAWCDRYPDRREEVMANLSVSRALLRLATDKRTLSPDVDAIIADVRENGIRMVIFDTLARTMTGLDENSAMDAGVVMEGMQKIVNETGACVVFIHHTGKDMTIGFRGSNSIGAAAQDHLFVTDGETPEGVHYRVSISHSKDGEAREVGFFKAEGYLFARAPTTFTEDEWVPVLVPIADKPESFKEREKGAVKAGQNKPSPAKGTNKEKIIAVVRDFPGGISREALANELAMKTEGQRKALRTYLGRLANEGWVILEGEGRVLPGPELLPV